MHVESADRPRRELAASTIAAERLAGFTTLGRSSSLRVMMLLLTAQTAMFGALQVFIVVMAIDLLDLGEGGVGYLNAAIGVGAFVGAVAALSLTGARRLSPAFLGGLLVTGIPLVAVGLWQEVAIAVAALALMGIGNAFVDVAGLTLVQRTVPDDVLARVFGVIQMLWMASMGIGAALAPALIAWLGVDGALIVTGVVPPRRWSSRSARPSRASTAARMRPTPTSCASSRPCRSSRRCRAARSSISQRAWFRCASTTGA